MFESFFTFLIAWYNLPFTRMLLLGVALAGLQLLGLSHDGDTDADGDLDADTDLAIHHDLNHDIDHDFDHDIDHNLDHDAEHDVEHDTLSGFSWLAFIGIGKAPLMVIILIVLMTI